MGGVSDQQRLDRSLVATQWSMFESPSGPSLPNRREHLTRETTLRGRIFPLSKSWNTKLTFMKWLGDNGGLVPMLNMANSDGLQPKTTYTFPQIFDCPDPTDATTYGFQSWDRFFTRNFKPGMRPVASPDDDTIIVHACESAPLQCPVSSVQLSDNFQGKNQNYSLIDMMNKNPLVSHFVGGTVYQAFLSCLSYHRWQAPISGTVVETDLVGGTYYSENLYQTFFGHWPAAAPGDTPDPAGPTYSQPYIASVAARGLIYIQADNPDIGLVCFIAIGMSDTSGCEIDVTPGRRLKKGGMCPLALTPVLMRSSGTLYT